MPLGRNATRPWLLARPRAASAANALCLGFVLRWQASLLTIGWLVASCGNGPASPVSPGGKLGLTADSDLSDVSEAAGSQASDAAPDDACCWGIEEGDTGTGNADGVPGSQACPLQYAQLASTKPFGNIGNPACTAKGCWAITGPAMPYFGPYVPELQIYHWLFEPWTAKAWTIAPSGTSTELTYLPSALAALEDGVFATGGVSVVATQSGQTPQHMLSKVFRCVVDLEGSPTCTTTDSEAGLPNLLRVPGGELRYLSTLTPSSSAATLLFATPGAPQDPTALSNKLTTNWPGVTWIGDAIALGPDTVVTQAASCHGARFSAAGELVWDVTWPKTGVGLAESCQLLSVTPDGSSLVVARTSDAEGQAVELRTISAKTGAVNAAAIEAVFAGHLGIVAAIPIQSALTIWYSRWWTAEGGNDTAMVVHDFKTLRTRSVRTGILGPGGTHLSGLALLPDPLRLGFTAQHTNGNVFVGLADTWGNTTCEDSGPCWQKTYSDCTDSNPCTSDLCDAAHSGCYHVPLPDGITCSDAGGKCQAGMCN